MTIFWIISAAMMLAALAMLAPALLRQREIIDQDQREHNIRIARERLAEWEADLAAGVITQKAFDQSKEELEATLLDDVQGVEGAQRLTSGAGRGTLIALLVAVPLASVALYLHLGAPQYLDVHGPGEPQPTAANPHAAQGVASVEQMAEGLRQRLAEEPDNAEGWFMLGRTYMMLKQYPKAIEALERTRELVGDQANILLGLADSHAMINGGNLAGKPTEYVEAALKLEPDNVTGLWLGALSAEERGAHQLAIDRFSKLLPKLAEDANSQQEVRRQMARVREAARAAGVSLTEPTMAEAKPAAQPQPAAAGGSAIKAWVSLDESLAAKLSGSETVFIFARAVSGPPMPLAVVKKRVSDLPFEATLDDSLAMMPQLKLSGFDKVKVSARVSLTGQPTAQPGDYSSEQLEVALSEPVVGVELTINQVVGQ